MKTREAAAWAIAALIGLCAIYAAIIHTNENQKFETLYPETAMITSIDEDADIITVMTANGNMFRFETQTEDWMPGDLVSMIMDDNGTASVMDDEIVKVQYSGYLDLYADIEKHVKEAQ